MCHLCTGRTPAIPLLTSLLTSLTLLPTSLREARELRLLFSSMSASVDFQGRHQGRCQKVKEGRGEAASINPEG